MHAKHWLVDVFVDEDDDVTRAQARLRTRDKTHLVGRGLARRNPHDLQVPAIGDELAAARALADLAHRLLDVAAGDMEAPTQQHLSTRL